MNSQLYVSSYNVVVSGERRRVECKRVKVAEAQLNKYAEELKDYLLKLNYTKTRSYDSSDDDRVTDSYSSYDGVRYYEIDVMNDSEHLIVEDDKVVGVVFTISPNSGSDYTRAFLFDGTIQERISMGYSASHSSDWTYINNVYLVKRGEDGAPSEGNSIRFRQAEMYPSI